METLRTILTLAGIALIAAIGAGLYVWRNRDALKELAKELKETDNIKDALRAVAFSVVTQMEREHGDGTGALKLSNAIGYLLERIPEKYRGYFDAQALTDIVEDALSEAKTKWDANKALLAADSEPVRLVALRDLRAGEVADMPRGIAVLVEGDGAGEDNPPLPTPLQPESV